MIKKVLTEELIGLPVITETGTNIGILEEIVVELETGEIDYFLIRTSTQTTNAKKIDARGRLIYSFSSMKMGDKSIIVS